MSYFSITPYFNFSTNPGISPAIFGHKRQEFPQSRKSVYSSRSGKVRSRVENFLRNGRFAKSRGCRLNAGNWKNDGTCTDREPLCFLSFYLRGKSEKLLDYYLVTLNFDISRVFVIVLCN